jgi:hypothetical protein
VYYNFLKRAMCFRAGRCTQRSVINEREYATRRHGHVKVHVYRGLDGGKFRRSSLLFQFPDFLLAGFHLNLFNDLCRKFRISNFRPSGGQSTQLTNSCDDRASHVSWPCTCLKTRPNVSQHIRGIIPKCIHNVAPRLMQFSVK